MWPPKQSEGFGPVPASRATRTCARVCKIVVGHLETGILQQLSDVPSALTFSTRFGVGGGWSLCSCPLHTGLQRLWFT